MEELKHYYMLLVDGQIAPSTADGVFQADSLIPKQLKKELLTCATVLENVPDNKKDWHPGSNNQVLDLVNPSLYLCQRQDTCHRIDFHGSGVSNNVF